MRKKVELDTVMFAKGGKGRELMAMIRNPGEYRIFADNDLAQQMTADYINIKDKQDRIVNETTFIQATQYREIFVQKIEAEPASSVEISGIDKFTPLNKAEVTTNVRNFEDYWMNTPLKKD